MKPKTAKIIIYVFLGLFAATLAAMYFVDKVVSGVGGR